jgi:tRNA(adenine34) deaminase
LDPIDPHLLMGLALDEADQAPVHGDVPVGCVVVDALGCVIGSGHNRRQLDQDPTAHAELIALRAAASARGHWRLDDCTLVVTLEPCPMCAGALVNARIARVVYGCPDPKAGAVRSLFQIADDQRLNHRAQIVEGVRAEECASRLTSFFAALRRLGKK